MLTIFRGDDLAFAESNRRVCVRFNTCLDLTGWMAEFCLFDNVKTSSDISSRIWTFDYTAEETQAFPLGKTFGKLIVRDSKGQIRQLAKVEVEIVNQKCVPAIEGFISISIDNVISDYNILSNKPVLNGKVIEGVHDSKYYGIEDADVEDLTNRLNDEIETRSRQASELGAAITEEVSAREAGDQTLAQSIEATRTGLLQNIAAAVSAETSARNQAITSIVDGTTPISSLLFIADGDDDNFYRIQVVMRDDGAGGVLPALALDSVPRE